MEKETLVKIVGNAPEEAKSNIQNRYHERLFGEEELENFSTEEREEIKNAEFPKSQEELELISFVDKKTNDLMEKAGLSGFETPVRNIYILPEDIYKKYVGKDTAGGFVWEDRIIFINGKYSKQNLLFFAKLIFHELLHLKQKTVLEAQAELDEEGYWVTAYRGGLHVLSSQKARRDDRGHQHFAGLNEAMVASQEKEFVEESLRLPLMKSEQDWLSSEEAKAIMENMARERKVAIEDIVWADKEGKTFFTINYPRQREVLDYICEEIQKDNNNSYESKNEVADEFLQSFFSGKLLRIARLTESTFGEGSFRILGAMGKDEEMPLHILDILRSMRNRKLKYGKNT